MPKIAVGGFQHETNTFVDATTTYDDFLRADAWPGLTRGAAAVSALAGRNIGMAGLLDGAAAQGWEVAPLAWCGGGAGGMVEDDAFERLSQLLLADLKAAGPIDGVLLDLHGAMTTQSVDDADAEFLGRVRRVVGPETPIVCSLDLHANISPEMVALADMLVVYRTYPHLDMAATGRRAAARLGDILRAGRRPTTAFRPIPFLIPTIAGCTLREPAQSIYAALDNVARRDGVVEIGVACGFSPSDTAHTGPSVLCYADDAGVAAAGADALAAMIVDHEAAFAERLASVDAAVAGAIETARRRGGPILLADVDDNAGAGEPSDTAWILEALIRDHAPSALVGLLYDPSAVESAHIRGLGAAIDVALGGSASPPAQRRPYAVEGLSQGRFQGSGGYLGDVAVDLGPMALLRSGGVRVLVSSRREQAIDPAMFTHIGVDPRRVDVLALKSSVHFRADFTSLAAAIVDVGAPDRPRDPSRLFPYRKLRPGTRMAPMGAVFNGVAVTAC